MPRKTFTPGEVLAAADVNTFLMDQSVMTFADSAARGSAIGTAIAQEGMLTYLEDTDAFEYWDGSAFTPLVSSSGAATNAIINGAFEINQRGFTSSTANAYGFDRWANDTDGVGATFSSQTFTPGAAPVAGQEARNFWRCVTTGQSDVGTYSILTQRIEGVRTLAGQTATISFYAKSGSGTPQIAIEFEQIFGSGGSSAVSIPVQAVTISTTWTRYSATVSIPSISGKTVGTGADQLRASLWVSAGSTWNTAASSIGIQSNTFDIWGVQVEAGSTATPFRRNANSLQGELAACQRYYYRISATPTATRYGLGIGSSTTQVVTFQQNPVQMRVGPTSVEFAHIRVTDEVTTRDATSLAIFDQGPLTFMYAVGVASGLTQFRPYAITSTNASAFIGLSAEL